MLSTPVEEFTTAADRARTVSGRVYALGRQISARDLDEEGRVALRLLLAGDLQYPGVSDDVKWVTAQKMARHLRVTAPPRSDPIAVERFLEKHHEAYLERRGGSGYRFDDRGAYGFIVHAKHSDRRWR